MRRTRPYHHTDLRETLLGAAIDLIAEVGPAGFTLREVARRAGVSHNAPYRHFRDKDALLAAVAAQGFRELTQAMRTAAGPGATALDRLHQVGLAYVSFALRRPEHFAVMFDAPRPTAVDPELAETGSLAFGTLVDCIEACQREAALPPGDTLARALVAWSLVHGIAKLGVAKRFPFRSRTEVLAFATSAIGGSVQALAWTERTGGSANGLHVR